jgi:delta8-fatty-acid desaturase
LYGLLIWYVAAVFQGILSLMLCSNHMDKPFVEKHGEGDPNAAEGERFGYIERHVRVTTNIWCPRWLDWTWGGLQFHIEHHMFPRMPREHYRTVSKYVKKFCKEQGITYNLDTFSGALMSICDKLQSMNDILDLMQ